MVEYYAHIMRFSYAHIISTVMRIQGSGIGFYARYIKCA